MTDTDVDMVDINADTESYNDPLNENPIIKTMFNQNVILSNIVHDMSLRDICNTSIGVNVDVLFDLAYERPTIFKRWMKSHIDDIRDMSFPVYIKEFNDIRKSMKIEEPYYLVSGDRFTQVGPLSIMICEDEIDSEHWYIYIMNRTDENYKITFHDNLSVIMNKGDDKITKMDMCYAWSEHCESTYNHIVKIEKL